MLTNYNRRISVLMMSEFTSSQLIERRILMSVREAGNNTQ